MVDDGFGHWLAGFIDGEGCFYIAKVTSRGTYRPRFSLSLRHDDSGIIDECHRRTGLGTVHYYKGQSGHRVVRWTIQSYADCAALVALLSRYPLRAKKGQDFAVWSRAVSIATQIRPGRADNTAAYAQLLDLKNELKEVRNAGL